MAKLAMRVKARLAPKFKSRVVRRCRRCGRRRAFLRRFEMCRICFRNLALQGSIPGVIKSSW